MKVDHISRNTIREIDPFTSMDTSSIDYNTRIIDLTVGELLDIVKRECNRDFQQPKAPEKNYEYGIGGIARIFNCSMTTANRIKKSGVIDGAISQNGRIIVVDKEMAIQLFNDHRARS